MTGSQGTKKKVQPRQTRVKMSAEIDLPFEESVGYQVRATHRALQRFLQLKIEPYGVSLGMWYFLRALWNEDGLTQRELSRRVGTTEPTTLTAILSMERSGLIRRAQNKNDRRRMHVYLSPKGRDLKSELMPLARSVVATAVHGFSAAETKSLLAALADVQRNIQASLSQLDETRLI
ncbi:MarR family winged helix-turn-helix transcriptional regulator [Pseudorhodoplanes sinuspersici]|uniref:MarR family winged helix-turn-helix transcriptional regulator n=1 Tax=Pseudorhodoplanes sinuspersici TaxID=1235591 RepID=UPI000FEE2837|nr:MarR family transcriptional regulator [Pseudorhodoplanes sinuspersici]RKE68214.1 DNA-binding MarR family transcriptional regulator [Pseudorhodoplanes sinuspersici]